MNAELKKLSLDIDELIRKSEEKEAELMSAKQINYSAVAIEEVRRNGYLECKSLIYKSL